MQQIGILLPRSTYYESISRDIFEGLRSGLQQIGYQDVKIVSENIGFGTDKRACYAAAERLLLQEDISVVFGYLSHQMAQLLRPLFVSMNRVLVILDAGSNMPQEWPVSSNILFHSLHNSLSYWLTSQMAGKDGYKEMGAVTGFYDGGYLHTYALIQSYQKQGGKIVYNHATGYRKEDFTMAPLKTYLANFPEACMSVLFSGDYVEWFFAGLKQHLPDVKPKIYASGFTLEESVLEQMDYPHAEIKGIVPWSSKIISEHNNAFINVLADKGVKANIFSLLGWEAALLGVPLLKLMEDLKCNGREAIMQFKKQTIEGPRGEISFDDNRHYSISPMYEVSVIADDHQKAALSIQARIDAPHKEFEMLSEESLEEITSGWHNSYTCI